MENVLPLNIAIAGIALAVAGLIAIYFLDPTRSRLMNALLPKQTEQLRNQLIELLELKITTFFMMLETKATTAPTKISIRENEPSQFQDEDMYVRAFREMLYVTSFKHQIIDPLNRKLNANNMEVYQYYLSRDSKGVFLTLEVRSIV